MMRQAWSWMFVMACGTDPLAPDDLDPCTGPCECRVDTNCTGVHEVCDDQGTSRVCACAAGYVPDAGGVCAWSGVVENPGFSSPLGWEIDGSATIESGFYEPGMTDPGAARWGGTGLCQAARVTQTVVMPRLSRAELLVAQVSFLFAGKWQSMAPSVGVGSAFSQGPDRSLQWGTVRICLGGGQYAPESSAGVGLAMQLTVMPAWIPGQCSSDRFDVDRIDVVPANPNECPAPGTALNGDAEGTGGWLVESPGGSGTSGIFVAGAGEDGTTGVRLAVTSRCSYASVLEPVSLPAPGAVASPALSFFHRATDQSMTSLYFGVSRFELSGTGSGAVHRICIPDALRGGVFDLRIVLSGAMGTCEAVDLESVFDNLTIVDDPSCGTGSST